MQHVATHCNRVAKCVQHVVRNNVVICCIEMLRVFGRAFKSILLFIRLIVLSIMFLSKLFIVAATRRKNSSKVSYVMFFFMASSSKIRLKMLKQFSIGLMSGLLGGIARSLALILNHAARAKALFWLGSPS